MPPLEFEKVKLLDMFSTSVKPQEIGGDYFG